MESADKRFGRDFGGVEERLVITADRVRTLAREAKLPAGVVEKDYALTWLLNGLYAKDSTLRNGFVLKGGTAIRKVYFPEAWRFSEDIDFTVVTGKEEDAIREGLLHAFDRLRSVSGINYSLESFHATEGAITANVQFVGPLNFPNRIKHDITLKERMVFKPEQRTVKSLYPDLPYFRVLVYSIDEILAEKIRSIMQRGYSRDYYDVWRLMKEGKFKTREFKDVLIKKCELNGIEYRPELVFDRDRLNEARAFWSRGLGHLLRELPNFDTVMSDLRESLRFLENQDGRSR